MNSNFTPKVSVIVPVYNTEVYVERAITSLMEQTLDDVQIIIIDDGSKDNSLNIIKEVIARYPARQRLVTLISRENRGVAATRAQGMELASGDYVIHLDSDDWVELNWLEAMYSKAVEENADVVVCDYRSVYATKSTHIKQPIGQDGIECVKKLLEGELHGSTWNKLVRRSLIVGNKLTFSPGINYLEDFILVIQIFLVANVIDYISLPLVNYNQTNVSSITATVSEQKVKEICVAIERISHILNDYELENQLANEVNIMKLKLKYWLFCCTKKNIPMYISGLFPETSGYISGANLSAHVKLVLFIAHHNLFLARVIMRTFHELKNIVS
ncbi:TPA: glycosyltransferase [Aeromonas sobria]|nr:glycosyltransferase [Aeromonas sobria]